MALNATAADTEDGICTFLASLLEVVVGLAHPSELPGSFDRDLEGPLRCMAFDNLRTAGLECDGDTRSANSITLRAVRDEDARTCSRASTPCQK